MPADLGFRDRELVLRFGRPLLRNEECEGRDPGSRDAFGVLRDAIQKCAVSICPTSPRTKVPPSLLLLPSHGHHDHSYSLISSTDFTPLTIVSGSLAEA